MKKIFMALTITAGCVFFARAQQPEKETLSAMEIVRRCDDLLRGEKSYTKMIMKITRPRWKRTVTMEGWTEGAEKVFIRILSPKKEKGVTFLKKNREAWQYVPAIDRIIKLPPSMMLQSWMGSDFTNDDVVRADSIIKDYTHKIVSEPVEGDTAYWTVDAVSKPDAPVVWGKVTLKIRKSNFVPDRVDFFDEEGKLVKYYKTSNIRTIEGRELATEFTMYDAIRKGHTTSIIYDQMTFKPDIKSSTFTLKNLKN